MTTIIVKTNDSVFFPERIDEEGISVYPMFKRAGTVMRLFRLILLRIGFSVPVFMYNSELKNCVADLFVVQDADAQIHFLKWMHKYHPRTRIVLWYWNTVDEMKRSLNPFNIPDYIEKWSYSQNDCNEYRMHYNTTFYIKPLLEETEDPCSKVDVFFVGKDKGRLNRLIEIRSRLEEYGLSTEFHICATRSRDRNKEQYSRRLSYDEIVQKIRSSKAILDCVVGQEAGPTIRPMEAMFWQKKLITDNLSIIHEDYYDPQNIFVIGYDDMNRIVDFVNTPYNENGYCSKYDLSAWAERFYVGKNNE